MIKATRFSNTSRVLFDLVTNFFALITTIFCVAENMLFVARPSVNYFRNTIAMSSVLLMLIALCGGTLISGGVVVYPYGMKLDLIVPGAVLGWFTAFGPCSPKYLLPEQISKKCPILQATLPQQKTSYAPYRCYFKYEQMANGATPK